MRRSAGNGGQQEDKNNVPDGDSPESQRKEHASDRVEN